MRRALPLLLALACALFALAPPAAAASARAVDFTPVLPALPLASRTFAPDSAAPPESTVFLQFIGICPHWDCGSGRPICSTDSILVTLGGSLPSDCYSIRKIFLYYPPIVTIRPSAPWVVVVVDDGACLDQVCVPGRYPWSGTIMMPPLPEGPYSLDVSVIRVSCSDSFPPPPSPTHSLPFAVVSCDSTPPPANCLVGDWRNPDSTGGCDAQVGPGRPAQVVFGLRSSVEVDALQGSFGLSPAGLQITGIETTGYALGYHLTWTQTPAGARFIMFNDGGASIPPDSLLPPGHPILLVTVSAVPGVAIPASTSIFAQELLGSDPDGNAVPVCPSRIPLPQHEPRDPALYFPTATICGAAECDVNHDAIADVRDLVLMVNCLHAPDRCGATYDCNRDGSFTLDDILCCAWRILRVAPCTNPYDCPPDSIAVRDGVRVRVGLPVEVAGEVHVPIQIDRADYVGAARLAMSFPADRWRIVSLDTDDAAWLTLAGEEHGEAIMGAIRMGDASGPGTLGLTLRLVPVGGAAAGGELGALTADLSATDGVRLAVPLLAPVRPLPGNPADELSENRPEPFSGETRFTLSLPTAATVELSVYDLGGRRVSTLHHGALQAGVSEFHWNGHDDGGARLGAGVYFYRAIVGGRAVSRRMVYLGGN